MKYIRILKDNGVEIELTREGAQYYIARAYNNPDAVCDALEADPGPHNCAQTSFSYFYCQTSA